MFPDEPETVGQERGVSARARHLFMLFARPGQGQRAQCER